MAIGAITVNGKPTPEFKAKWGARAQRKTLKIDQIQFAGDASYPTGGSPFKALFQAAVGGAAREIVAVLPADTAGTDIGYDAATGKLKVYSAAGTEATAATNLSTRTFKLCVFSM